MIEFPLLVPLVSFAIAASATPGPNVVMIAASGANFGFLRTVPHMLGICIGFPAMLIALGLGLDQIFKTWPQIHEVLKIVGTIYLVYLAWRIATASNADSDGEGGKPLTFLQAALFQWVNPKAWVVGISAIATFTTVGGDSVLETIGIAVIFLLVSAPTVGLWCLFGKAIRRFLSTPSALRAFNATMGVLVAGSVVLLYI